MIISMFLLEDHRIKRRENIESYSRRHWPRQQTIRVERTESAEVVSHPSRFFHSRRRTGYGIYAATCYIHFVWRHWMLNFHFSGPTLKLKRPVVTQMYANTIESFYADWLKDFIILFLSFFPNICHPIFVSWTYCACKFSFNVLTMQIDWRD